MWNTINSLYSGNYNNSVKDKTDLDKVTVTYDATNRRYKIGPFKVEYLEVYAGETQLAGMTGNPEITVAMDDENRTYNAVLAPNEWFFSYENERNKGYLPKYNVYPHSNEEFYININYKENMHKVTNVKFNFRCLKAESNFSNFDGDINLLDWTAKVELLDDKKTENTKCVHGLTNGHWVYSEIWHCGGHTQKCTEAQKNASDYCYKHHAPCEKGRCT